MYNIAVIGDRESVLGFKALGLKTVFADNSQEASAALDELAKSDTAIIYITEQLAVNMSETLSRYKDSPLPAIILIPGKKGSLGIGIAAVKASVERAVGADIFA